MYYKCVIFDFDGTLADTEHLAFNIYNELADKYKCKKMTKEEVQNIKHLSFVEILQLVDIPYTRVPKMIKEGQRLLKKNMESIKPFEANIKEILFNIRNNVELMGIITSNTSKIVKMFVENEDIDFFDFIQSSSLLKKEKKINSICKKYKLSKEEVLYIGDETRDIEACKNAQVKCGAVTWGYNYPEALSKHNPDYIIYSLKDIGDLL